MRTWSFWRVIVFSPLLLVLAPYIAVLWVWERVRRPPMHLSARFVGGLERSGREVRCYGVSIGWTLIGVVRFVRVVDDKADEA